jgi:hypothetical protein
MDKEINTAHKPIGKDLLVSQDADAAMMDEVHNIKKQFQNRIFASGEFFKGMGDGEVEFVQETGQSLLGASRCFGRALCGKTALGNDFKGFRTAIENTSGQALETARNYYFSQVPKGQAKIWNDIIQAGDAVADSWNALDSKQKGYFFGKEVVPWAVPGAVGIVAKEVQGANLIGKAGEAIASTLGTKSIRISLDTRAPAIVGAESAGNLPAFENKSFDDFIAKMKFLPRDIPSTTKLSGRVFAAHTTDSFYAKEGDIRIVWNGLNDGTGHRAYTNVWTNGKWAFANFFNGPMEGLFIADNDKTVLTKSNQLISWLENYKGKSVEFGKNERGYSEFKLSESDRPSEAELKQIAAKLGTDKLPMSMHFNGQCRFGSKPPTANSTDGSFWFKCPEGTKGKPLIGEWEPYVNVRGQWVKCKIDVGAIRGDLLHFESRDEAYLKARFINDAMHKGEFSIDRLVRDNAAKAPNKYLLRKIKN